MLVIRAKWSAYLDRQHRYPNGPFGQVIGERMVRQHALETAWSIGLLDLQPDDRVLEVGCGAGQGLALARKHGQSRHIIGVDLSATMLQSAARRNKAARTRGHIALLRGDIAALPFHEQHFDKIVSIHTFYFWLDPRAIVQQIIALLAPGGRCVTTFATARTSPDGERVYWPLHEHAQALVGEINQERGVHATFLTGPDSREFNNVAILIEKT
jgi:ubiquinone/menaquinone biosynthesis C-methylase UbiE